VHIPGPDDNCYQLFDALDQGFCTIEVLFDASGTPIDCRVLSANEAFEEQTGLRGAVGHRMRELVPPNEQHWHDIYGEVATTGTPRRFEHQAPGLDRWYDVYAFRVGDPEQHRVAVLFRDITARKQAERALGLAREEAEQEHRAKDEFIAMIAHELRAPLAPMKTALQLLRLKGARSREQEVLERQVDHLHRMVDELLDISRMARGAVDLQREPTELCQVVLSAMELAGPRLEQHFVDVKVPNTGAGVDVDRGRMAQVLANLLSNAAKYSDAGTRIVVAGGRFGGVVRTSVRDEGIGLAPDMLERIFEPFVQQPHGRERAAGGLGLGLAIVRNLVTAHGGTVRATSAGTNRGSEFVVELPAIDMPFAGECELPARDAGRA
jgi:PAS domain S-box-containing protein